MDWEIIGKKIREARLKKGLLQKDLAKLLGVTQTSYSYYENGKKHIGFMKLKKICQVLEIDISDL